MRALLWALVAVTACGGDDDGKAKPRPRDGAPVEVVERKNGGGRPLPSESEPNDADDKANPLAFPGGVRGTLNGETDVDVYKLTLTARTAIDVRLTGTGVDLVLELHTTEQLLAHSDRGPAGATEGLPAYPLDSGEYLLVVREFVKKAPPAKKSKKKGAPDAGTPPAGRTGESPPYSLTVAAAAAPQPGQESEPNGDNRAAAEAPLGQEAIGYLGWSDDVDLWRIDLTGLDAAYSVDIEVAVPEGAEAAMTVLDDNADKVLERTGGRGETVAARALRPSPGNEHFFVRLAARRSNPEEPYILRATSRLHDLDLEIEPNDAIKAATPLRDDARESGGTRRGWLGAGDVDYWRLPPGTPGTLSVTVTPPAEIDVKLAVVAGAPAAESFIGKRGIAERLDAVPVGEREAVVLKISGSGSSASPYELKWSVSDAVFDPYEDPEP